MVTKGRTLLIVLAVAVLLPGVVGCASAPKKPSLSSNPAETGMASYYHDRLHGRTTASGDVYDRNALTAAHRTLPFGTTVLVRNVENGKSVRLTINDRGPYVDGRILDVSRRAAEILGFVRAGLAKVTLEIMARPEHGR